MSLSGREKIIEAAFQLFLQKGYAGVSLSEIISISGMSKGAIYHHFDSKESIYRSVIDRYVFGLMESGVIDDAHQPLKTRIKNRYLKFVELLHFIEAQGAPSHGFALRNYFLLQLESERDDKIRDRLVEILKAYRKEMLSIVKQAKEKGELSVSLSASVISEQIIALIEGVAIHHSSVEKDIKQVLRRKYSRIIGQYIDLITQP